MKGLSMNKNKKKKWKNKFKQENQKHDILLQYKMKQNNISKIGKNNI